MSCARAAKPGLAPWTSTTDTEWPPPRAEPRGNPSHHPLRSPPARPAGARCCVFVFDTDVLSLLMKGRLSAAARERLSAVPARRTMTTAITLGELTYGALRSSTPERWLTAIAQVVEHLECLPFDSAAARRYGELRAHLESRGRRLDDPDLRIAAICSSRDLVLVSGNARHFGRVPGLRFENWLR